jgi:hypothetical protein
MMENQLQQPFITPPDRAYRIASIVVLGSIFYCFSGWLLSPADFLNSYLLMIIYQGITDLLLPLYRAFFALTDLLFFDSIVTLVVFGTLGIVCVYVARKSTWNLRRIKTTFVFLFAIPMILIGVFGSASGFHPINSLYIGSNSYNLAIQESSSDGTFFALYKCDLTRIVCKRLFDTLMNDSNGQLVYEANTKIISVLINGEVIYTHPIE